MKFLSLIFFLVYSCYTVGDIDGISEVPIETSPEESVEAPIVEPYTARLHLSLGQAAYASGEDIRVHLIFQTGTFNLLVPQATIESEGLLSNLVVKGETGKVINPSLPIVYEINVKRLVRNGKKIDCIPGMELKARIAHNIVVEDVDVYYGLKPGSYTLQVSMDLEVYQETLALESLLIHDAERRITRVRAKSKIAAHTRRKHIAGLERSIEALERQAEELGEIYLPLDSLRGSTTLESNVVTLEILRKQEIR